MKFNQIAAGATKIMAKSKLKIKKNSPEILIIFGIIGVVGGVVAACKATTKVEEVAEKANKELEEVDERHEDKNTSEYRKDKVLTYIKVAGRYIRLYAPSAGIIALSLGSIVSSHYILKKRNVALAASYATLMGSFKDYRRRVADVLGDEAETKLHNGVETIKLDETTVDENGKKKKTKKSVEAITKDPISPYARFFDETSRQWEEDANYNLMFLRNIETMFTDKLRMNGHVFLNDIYKALDIPPSKEGQFVGWIYDENHPASDNYVDLGIYNGRKPKTRDFVNGFENVFLIDPNVDGNIIDRLFGEETKK